MTFGTRLRALRKAAGMTQEKLARAADVSNATVFKLETSEGQDPSWSTVCRLADALGVSVQEFREQPEPAPPAKGKGKKGGKG